MRRREGREDDVVSVVGRKLSVFKKGYGGIHRNGTVKRLRQTLPEGVPVDLPVCQ